MFNRKNDKHHDTKTPKTPDIKEDPQLATEQAEIESLKLSNDLSDAEVDALIEEDDKHLHAKPSLRATDEVQRGDGGKVIVTPIAPPKVAQQQITRQLHLSSTR